MNNRFESIRPYREDEIAGAMQRIAHNISFPLIASYVFPDRNIEDVRREVASYKTTREFQMKVMYWANKRIIEESTTSFACGGTEHIDERRNNLFISNHRDIMLDASLLQNVLIDHGHDTCEITFGANLMQGDMLIDIGKSNKMFRVERPGSSAKEFYKASMLLSDYIRHVITEKGQSVWIAQRNGRTKDGKDRTDQGIIKMLSMSSQDDKVTALAELNILPVSVSYEWEPCDILKTVELYERQYGPYIKKPGEDLNSILTGITQDKGNVRFEICEPISLPDLNAYYNLTSGEFHRQVATLIDRRICAAYHLFPNNYIAHDILYGRKEYAGMYNAEERRAFMERMEMLRRYEEVCDIDRLNDIFLGIYANPVENRGR